MDSLRNPAQSLSEDDHVQASLAGRSHRFERGMAALVDEIELAEAEIPAPAHRPYVGRRQVVAGRTVTLLRRARLLYGLDRGIAQYMFIRITQSGDVVPFGLIPYRYIQYWPNAEGLTGLTRDVSMRMGEIRKGLRL